MASLVRANRGMRREPVAAGLNLFRPPIPSPHVTLRVVMLRHVTYHVVRYVVLGAIGLSYVQHHASRPLLSSATRCINPIHHILSSHLNEACVRQYVACAATEHWAEEVVVKPEEPHLEQTVRVGEFGHVEGRIVGIILGIAQVCLLYEIR